MPTTGERNICSRRITKRCSTRLMRQGGVWRPIRLAFGSLEVRAVLSGYPSTDLKFALISGAWLSWRIPVFHLQVYLYSQARGLVRLLSRISSSFQHSYWRWLKWWPQSVSPKNHFEHYLPHRLCSFPTVLCGKTTYSLPPMCPLFLFKQPHICGCDASNLDDTEDDRVVFGDPSFANFQLRLGAWRHLHLCC
jgi:hypothetical protein